MMAFLYQRSAIDIGSNRCKSCAPVWPSFAVAPRDYRPLPQNERYGPVRE